jgi:5-methylcytosine-specific restriction endonuclease McrA
VRLVEEAQALLSHSAPRATVDEIHLRAMRALVAELKRQKCAVTARPRKGARGTPRPAEPADGSGPSDDHERPHEPEQPRRRGRHIPAAVRRAVFERDEGRCTYADASGRRCHETRCIDLHHLKAFALGGEHTEANLTLRCRAHNALAAEEDFGRGFVQLARGSNEHEPWTRHAAPRAAKRDP